MLLIYAITGHRAIIQLWGKRAAACPQIGPRQFADGCREARAKFASASSPLRKGGPHACINLQFNERRLAEKSVTG